MDSIFHERQEGQLCAQHCLNNLLQGPYFTAVDLAKFARELDEDERMRMLEGGYDSPQYLRFLKEPSANMDDSGYFSVQVISRALEVWLLTMTPLSSPRMKDVLDNPVDQKAFICNHDNHWLTVRKLGLQWFDLNSLHRDPELISNTYLSLFLTQLQMEGYTIFAVEGELPACEADQLLSLVPIETQLRQSKSTPLSSAKASGSTGKPSKAVTKSSGGGRGKDADNDDLYTLELAKALSVSMAAPTDEFKGDEDEEFDMNMAAALSQSIQDQQQSQLPTAVDEHKSLEQLQRQSSSDSTGELSQEELRQKRLLRFEQEKISKDLESSKAPL